MDFRHLLRGFDPVDSAAEPPGPLVSRSIVDWGRRARQFDHVDPTDTHPAGDIDDMNVEMTGGDVDPLAKPAGSDTGTLMFDLTVGNTNDRSIAELLFGMAYQARDAPQRDAGEEVLDAMDLDID